MTAKTGRTIQDFVSLKMGAAGGSMTVIPIDTLGDIGLNYPEVEMSAWVDAVKGYLVGKPDFSLDFGGPLDNTASTGSHVLLSSWLGVPTALSFDVQCGIQHAWEATEPQFGCTGVVASNSGVMVTKYVVSGGRFSATIRMIAGSAAGAIPAWGTAAEAIPS